MKQYETSQNEPMQNETIWDKLRPDEMKQYENIWDQMKVDNKRPD